MRTRSPFALKLLPFLSIAVVASVGSSCNLDPVHRSAVNALGEEQGDLYPEKSQYHRPGEPCALCHSKQGPADTTFVLGGTVFWGPDNYDRRVPNAYVRVLDANKTQKCFVTNCNGNFYVTPDQFSRLTFPILVSVETTKDPGKDAATGQGTLNINSIPVSKVLLDGRPIGSTPKAGVSVAPGSHTVTFVKDGERKSVTVTVKAGETKVAAVKF